MLTEWIIKFIFNEVAALQMLAAATGLVGLAECMARVYSHASNAKLKVSAILAFVCGAIAIGLVLLDHKHCSAGGDAHAGHNHGGGAVDAHAGHNHGRLLSLAF